MKIQARIESASVDAKTGDALLTLRTLDTKLMPMLSMLEKKELTVELNVGKKRSLNANAYAWVLIDRLAQKTGIPKKEIYKETIMNVGGVSEICCVQEKSKDSVARWWESHGEGWQVVERESQLDGCVNLELFCGSSAFTVEQMQRFISLLQDECVLQNINILTPSEVANMMSLWSTR